MNASAIADLFVRPMYTGPYGQADETSFALRQGLRQHQQHQPTPEVAAPAFDAAAVQVDIGGFGDNASGWNPPPSLLDITI